MTASRRDIVWPTVRGQLASGREPVVYIWPRLADLRMVLVSAQLLAGVYRAADAPDVRLEAAINRLSEIVEEADDSRRPVAPATKAIQSYQRLRDGQRRRRARRTA